MILNIAGGIAGGIWLAILGEWTLIVIGVLLFFISHWILSIIMLPNLLIAGIASHLYERKNPLAPFLGFLSQLYINLLIVGTCVFAFFICSHYYSGETSITYVPYLLWSWGMALGPWQFFASKEPDNEFFSITLFSASVFYFLFLTSIFISPILRLIIIVIFGAVQLLILPIFNMYIAHKLEITSHSENFINKD